jgi:hypothetical protein
VQPAKHRLNARATAFQRAKQSAERKSPSQKTTAELLSASNSRHQLLAADSLKTTSPKGQISCMRELVQIDSPSEHACGQPSIERWQVLEPVTGRWSWIRVFSCCNQVAVEPMDEEQDETRVRRAA